MSNNKPAFDLDDPALPQWIEEGALRSGGYPYDNRLPRKKYNAALYELQKQLVDLQSHLLKTGERVLILFEGNDAAGKGGALATYRKHLNPRNTIGVALAKPSDREQGEWYFQRYSERLPARGETVLFDRSWYNRAGVEAVMGFASQEQVDRFLEEAPRFERMLVNDGIHLFKFWLAIGREMQLKRLHARRHNPLKTWKLSPVDLKGLQKWDEYQLAITRMLPATDTPHAPWTVVLDNDKKRGRLDIIRTVLRRLDFKGKDDALIGMPDPLITLTAEHFVHRLGEQ